MHYLFYDTETGGLDYQKHSLLTAYFGVYTEDLVLKDDLYLQLKPDNLEDLVVDQAALDINNINLEEHLKDPETVTYQVGGNMLMDLLTRNKIKGKRKHFTPAGHNIPFDNDFIFSQLFSKDKWNSLVHYHAVDTVAMATILKKAGFLSESQKISLTDLAALFNIPEIDAHNARGDIKMNVEVYKAMIKMLTDLKKNAAGSGRSDDLLSIVED